MKDGRVAVMTADLDRFKHVNDQFGHTAGDAVLVGTASRLRAALRPVDLLARIGGEEFLIAMPDVAENTARGFAQRMCDIMRDAPVDVPGLNLGIPVTMSIGVALGGNHNLDRSVDALLRNADRALYAAKSNGRDQVTIA